MAGLEPPAAGPAPAVRAGCEGAGAGRGHGGEGPAGVLVRGTGQPAALSRTVPFAVPPRTARPATALLP
ncbi:hypothetical protein G6F32_017461 [Rhizopus arrhizus]|nr:hypothetical protein G6F32_017461 [Rhizopus arrhizus]